MKVNQIFALVFFVAAKLSGLGGLALGYMNHGVLGGTLLALAFVFIGITITICCVDMRNTKSKDQSDIERIKKMISEGTIKQALKEAGY
jgi:hypothetical protein